MEMQENVTDSVPCPMANFGICGVESSRFISTLRQLTCSRTRPVYCRCTFDFAGTCLF
jgi:hypothetical protein